MSEEQNVLEYTPQNTNPHISRLKFELCVEENWSQQNEEHHQKRLLCLRRELDLIQSTEWIYGPIEKYIGQTQVSKQKF
uniref:Putative secreted protein n=1 Tax=Xenopsylla cheopis TaxID=163159 RepID=A0A6M2DU49_XENCH